MAWEKGQEFSADNCLGRFIILFNSCAAGKYVKVACFVVLGFEAGLEFFGLGSRTRNL